MNHTNKPSNNKINYKAKRLEIVFRDINGKRYIILSNPRIG